MTNNNDLAERIEAFVREIEKADVKVTGWDDEAAYFTHADFTVRVSIAFSEEVHTITVNDKNGTERTMDSTNVDDVDPPDAPVWYSAEDASAWQDGWTAGWSAKNGESRD